jgi:hypothetical protein
MDGQTAPTLPVKKEKKIRKNVSLAQDAINKGKALQKKDKRGSFTNMLEKIIDEKYDAVFPEGDPYGMAQPAGRRE